MLIHGNLTGEKILVLLNFSSKPAIANTDIDLTNANLLIGNYTSANNTTALRPYEAVVYELKRILVNEYPFLKILGINLCVAA